MFTPSLAVAAPDPISPSVNAATAIAVDASSARILYSKNMHRRLPMASTTKIMTALTALWIEGTNLSDTYQVVKEDLVGEAAMGLRNGEVVSFEALLYGLMLNSGNDAAMAIAHYAGAKLPNTGADPVTRFVERMNQNAVNLGMRNSHYANPHGLDQAEHYTSAFDLAITGWYALKNPTLSKIVATRSTLIAGHNLANINRLLQRYGGANGIKPGFTDNAGYCLVASASRGGQTVISVIMGDDARSYNSDPDTLLNYGFSQLSQSEIQQTIQQGATTATATDFLGRASGDRLIPLNSATVGGSANNANIVNIPANGGVINAQINQGQITPGATITPQTDNTSSTGSSDTSSTKKEGGFNLFGLLFVLLIAVGVFYCLLRFTPLGGDRGRSISYLMEDYAARGFQLARSGVQKVWGFVRPGSHEDQPEQQSLARPRPTSPPTNPMMAQPDRRPTVPPDPNRVSRPRTTSTYTRIETNLSDEPSNDTEAEQPNRQRPARPIGYSGDTPLQPRTRPNTEPPTGFKAPASEGLRGPNPLENFFDDVDPFKADLSGDFKPASTEPAPPKPLPPTRPAFDYPNRTAAEPQQKPDESSSGYRLPPTSRPHPLSDSFGTPSRPPLNPGIGPSTPPGGSSYVPPRSNTTPPPAPRPPAESLENLAMRARQAIDYAYAGRIGASTDEFRRVVDQEPLFDFGSIEEFDQMPLLGFKALATAYRDSGHFKFAILLLDMAIDHYPNNLELRSMQRNIRRDAEQ